MPFYRDVVYAIILGSYPVRPITGWSFLAHARRERGVPPNPELCTSGGKGLPPARAGGTAIIHKDGVDTFFIPQQSERGPRVHYQVLNTCQSIGGPLTRSAAVKYQGPRQRRRRQASVTKRRTE